MLSTSFPTPAHKALPEASAQVPHPCSFASEVDAVNPQRICFYHSGEVSVRGAHVLAFCNTITSPGLQPIARQVRRVTFDFEHVRPTRACLEAVADALAAMPNVEELTLLGMPNRDIDGWILRGATFRLWLFATTMSLTSKDVLDFLRAQPDITSLGTFSPPLPDMPQAAKNAYQHMPFPADVARRLTTLDCSAPFLLSLQAASPPTRPLVNMRVDLNRLNPNVESESLKALAAYSSSVKRLSLRRTTLRQLPATGDRSGALSMAAVLNRAAPNKRWARTEFLEMYDGTYDATAIPTLSQSIAKCFPVVETVVWAPSTHPAGSTASASCIAIIFFTFCRRLRHFIFLNDASDPANKQYVLVEKQVGGGLHAEPIGSAEVENMWKQTASSK